MCRQVKRQFRKPLIVPVSKRLLKSKEAFSTIEQFGEGLRYLKVRPDNDEYINKNPQQVKRLLICSGQVINDLIDRRTKLDKKDTAIIALEQIAPFPYKEFLEQVKLYPNAELVWVQEEHRNQGSWTYVKDRIKSIVRYAGMENRAYLNYVGRKASSASATGFGYIHEKELQTFLSEAFN